MQFVTLQIILLAQAQDNSTAYKIGQYVGIAFIVILAIAILARILKKK